MIVNNIDREWKPNTTVAAIVERDSRFLMVEENTPDGLRLNQPAGHLERGETLLQAVIRETREESGWRFAPRGLLGVYLADKPGSDITYVRFAFCGEALAPAADAPLDDGIVAVRWLTRDEIATQADRLRSPVVLRCVDDYLAGIIHPLELIRDLR
ncbi:NUDIX hydrolase [Chromobacterium alticapitis]|uniref:Phosphatase NudJ n=1 Tax=Chromobacterium alticapitis TaxID=2073169 RepID=A0A2S5DH16_9NEIS|nr:NUDIX hydrolase [Chromobacterium alticapitis]POZ62292.1 NUDIX hydrolase [Chromobacterium alticapitis]